MQLKTFQVDEKTSPRKNSERNLLRKDRESAYVHVTGGQSSH